MFFSLGKWVSWLLSAGGEGGWLGCSPLGERVNLLSAGKVVEISYLFISSSVGVDRILRFHVGRLLYLLEIVHTANTPLLL